MLLNLRRALLQKKRHSKSYVGNQDTEQRTRALGAKDLGLKLVPEPAP